MTQEMIVMSALMTDFADWSIANHQGYDHLANGGAANIKRAPQAVKDADARLHMQCSAFMGKRKSTDVVNTVGAQAFANGGGVCTTSAFALGSGCIDF